MGEVKEQTSGSKMTITTIVIMNITAVVSLRFLPSEAEYSLGAIIYYAFAALVFLVPHGRWYRGNRLPPFLK